MPAPRRSVWGRRSLAARRAPRCSPERRRGAAHTPEPAMRRHRSEPRPGTPAAQPRRTAAAPRLRGSSTHAHVVSRCQGAFGGGRVQPGAAAGGGASSAARHGAVSRCRREGGRGRTARRGGRRRRLSVHHGHGAASRGAVLGLGGVARRAAALVHRSQAEQHGALRLQLRRDGVSGEMVSNVGWAVSLPRHG